MSQGYIKLHRKLLESPTFKCAPTMACRWLAIVLLLKASHKENEWIWNGDRVSIGRGELITSFKSLARDSGLTLQEVRTAIKWLESPAVTFLTRQVTRNSQRITICNYDRYQVLENEANTPPNTQVTHSQHTPNTPLTSINNVKECTRSITTTTVPARQGIEKPLVEHVIAFGQAAGIPEDYCRDFYDHYETNSWFTGQGWLIPWKKMIKGSNWWGNDEMSWRASKRRNNPATGRNGIPKGQQSIWVLKERREEIQRELNRLVSEEGLNMIVADKDKPRVKVLKTELKRIKEQIKGV